MKIEFYEDWSGSREHGERNFLKEILPNSYKDKENYSLEMALSRTGMELEVWHFWIYISLEDH